MILKIDQMAAEPIYMQIRNQIVAAIAQGELGEGDGLPSVRRLAEELGINLHTVNKAYALLRDEGYVIMRGRNGARITKPEHAISPDQRKEAHCAMTNDLEKIAIEFKAYGGSMGDFLNAANEAARSIFSDREHPNPPTKGQQ